MSLGSSSHVSGASSWDSFEEKLFRKGEDSQDSAMAGGHLIDTGPSGVGRVLRETWSLLPQGVKEAGTAFGHKLIGSSNPFRVTTLCSGTDGVMDTMKAWDRMRSVRDVGL